MEVSGQLHAPAALPLVAIGGEMIIAFIIFVGKPEGKSRFGRPRRRWEDNIRMDVREIGLEAVDWIHLSQDRNRWRAVVNTTMNIRVR
jgi:hypothetical protein